MTQLQLLAAALLLTTSMHATAQRVSDQLPWPTPALPEDATLRSVGDHININGVPARIFNFTTSQPPEKVIQRFREGVESKFARVAAPAMTPGQITAGGRVGDFWLALQLREKSGGTSGTWSAMPTFMPNIRQSVARPAGFPASAKLIQQIDSFDVDKNSQMAVGVDPSPVDGVAQRLEDELRGQGFEKQALPRRNWPAPDQYVAVFSKAREEIWITLRQERTGTTVVVNRLSALEMFE